MPCRTYSPVYGLSLAELQYLAVTLVSTRSIHWPRQCGYAVVALQSISLLQSPNRWDLSDFARFVGQSPVPSGKTNNKGTFFQWPVQGGQPKEPVVRRPAYNLEFLGRIRTCTGQAGTRTHLNPHPGHAPSFLCVYLRNPLAVCASATRNSFLPGILFSTFSIPLCNIIPHSTIFQKGISFRSSFMTAL